MERLLRIGGATTGLTTGMRPMLRHWYPSRDDGTDRLLQRAWLRRLPGCLLPRQLKSRPEFLKLMTAEPGPHLREPLLLLFFDVMGHVLDQHSGLRVVALLVRGHRGQLEAENIGDMMLFVRLEHVIPQFREESENLGIHDL